MTDEPDPERPESPAGSHAMQIVSAVFVEDFNMRQAPGPSTRIDLTGVMFSMAAPSPVPVTLDPHLVALIYCPPDVAGSGVFEVVFRRTDDPDVPAPDAIDPLLFSPAEIRLVSVASGRGFHAGDVNPEVLARSFWG